MALARQCCCASSAWSSALCQHFHVERRLSRRKTYRISSSLSSSYLHHCSSSLYQNSLSWVYTLIRRNNFHLERLLSVYIVERTRRKRHCGWFFVVWKCQQSCGIFVELVANEATCRRRQYYWVLCCIERFRVAYWFLCSGTNNLFCVYRNWNSRNEVLEKPSPTILQQRLKSAETHTHTNSSTTKFSNTPIYVLNNTTKCLFGSV